MIKKALLLLGVACLTITASQAQTCITDEVNKKYLEQNPEIAQINEQLERDIAENIQKMKLSALMRGTADDTDTAYLDIPVVVHVIHDYGVEYLADNKIYQLINELNAAYSKLNVAELANVIPTFVPYIGNMHIRFHLATKDPQGNPTHGITRSRTYLTAGGDDQAKLDYWPQSSYLNIWFERVIGQGATANSIVAAYSMLPASAQFQPYYDGLIANYQFINSTGIGSNTVPHEIGHFFNLAHPWGNTNSPGVSCGDDNVDDTPPTMGHFSGCDVYDVTCAVGYTKNGIDYPDTANTQNIMDYANCALMFTKGQTERSRAALRSTIANRSTLFSAANLAATGALDARPTLPPIADFSNTRYFGCVNTNVFSFTNRSWNDTVNSVSWTFSNGATNATSTAATGLTQAFTEPGWVNVTLTATGRGGTNTVTKQSAYIADPNATSAVGYYQEFAPGGDVDKYPIFNYYNTSRKWELANNAGYFDQYSMKYTNNDTRTGTVDQATNTPDGDYADFFTPAFNLSDAQFTGAANLTFLSSGAYRTSIASQMNDLLEITYSIDCGSSWRKLDSLKGAEIGNNAVQTADFTPQNASQWQQQGFALPAAAKAAKVFFRFRYYPGVNASSRGLVGTGNNFYLDRINITSNPTGINEQELAADGIALAPNPTTGNAWIVLNGKNSGTAQVHVTDVTGKLVYSTSQTISGTTKIEIPAAALTVKGMYLVQVITDSKLYSRKLVAY